MTRETIITLAILLAVMGEARADTYHPSEPVPMYIAACDPITGAQRDIFGQMQPPARYVAGPILLDMEALLPVVSGGGQVAPHRPVEPGPVPIPATIALLAPALMLAAWLMTRRKAK